MFSAFDAFTGDLLRALFTKKPLLFNSLKRQVEVATIMESGTLEELKRNLVEEEIEAFRRESYADQFGRLENLFGIKLKSFPRYPEFIERSQRRNLLTHCDGIVSDQYVSACKNAGGACAEKVGDRLDIPLNCLIQTVELLMEVGIKLGHTLWRKVLPDELEAADDSLNKEIYDRLRSENWNRAFVLAKFAIEQPKIASDGMKKIFAVNYIIAAKFGGQPEKAAELLASLDWSGAAPDFRLAKAVLEDRYEDASKMMEQVGKRTTFLDENSYYVFPLFRTFRLQECFRVCYEKVFGRPFAAKIQEGAVETKSQLEQSATQQSLLAENVSAEAKPVTSE